MRQAVILAGGKGTRLRSILGDLPKPLAEICGRPLLGHQLDLLSAHRFDEVVLLVSYGAPAIEQWLSESERFPFRIKLLADETPLGTGGAVLAAIPHLAPDFAVLYGDTMLSVDLTRFWDFHRSHEDAAASIFVHPNDHPQDSDLVEQDVDGNILKFHPYPHPPDSWLPNLVNAALYVLRRDALLPWSQAKGALDFGKNLFPEMLQAGLLLRAYNSPEYIKDAGTPARLQKVRAAYSAGVVRRSALVEQQRAVLIDRDGTLNEDVGHLGKAEELHVFESVGAALRRLNEAEWRTVVVTNQPVLARGEADAKELRRIHARLDTEVARHQAYFDRLYYCPHHPDRGFSGEIPALKVVCDCRKPAIGMIQRAASDLNLDLAESWLVGDSTADLGAAENAGVTSILVETGSGGLDERYPFEPGISRPDFEAAVAFILDDYPRIVEASIPILTKIEPGQDWFIGGRSRSGKSTFASVIARELRRHGNDAVVVQLDRWLLASRDRQPSLFGRFDFNSMEAAFRVAATRSSGAVTLDLPTYSHRRRERLQQSKSVRIAPGTIVLWEGVVALQLARIFSSPSTAIQVNTAENQRCIRFHKYNARHGLSQQDSDAAWSSRTIDEHPIITALEATAAFQISLDGLLSEVREGVTQ